MKSISKKLKIMCINCDSLRSVDKRAEQSCLVNHHNPHIILCRESRLGPDIPSCKVFPKGFKSFRRDRVMSGGGVFILVREDIVHVEDVFPNDNKDCENAWVHLKLFNARLLNIASFYWKFDWSILVVWLECRFLDTEVDGSNPGISMLCP